MGSKNLYMNRGIFWLALGIVLTLSSFAGLHKFYLSVTNVDYAEKEESLQIISRIFVDDMENALKTRYDFDARLGRS